MTSPATSRDTAGDEQLYHCCECSRVLRDPMLLLDCLHNCCRECLDGIVAATSRAANRGAAAGDVTAQAHIMCRACDQIVDGSRCKPNGLLAAQIAGLGLQTTATTCDICMDESSPDGGWQSTAAVSWCSDCRKSLCCRCSERHQVFGKGHETVTLNRYLPQAVPVASTPTTCGVCAPRNEAAVTWCVECDTAFCKLCAHRHAFFSKGHRTTAAHQETEGFGVAGTSSSSATAAGHVHLCATHGKQCEFFCFDCKDLRCADCAKMCLETRHEVKAVNSDAAHVFWQQVRHEVTSTAERVQRKLSVLADASPNLSDLEAARKIDAEKIKDGTKALLDEIDKAYCQAESAVNDAYESLADRVPSALAIDAERLGGQLEYVFEYLDALVDSGDVVSLLDQQSIVLACLRQLAGDAAVLPPIAADIGSDGDSSAAEGSMASWTLVQSEQQPGFDELVQRHVGIVRPETPLSQQAALPNRPAAENQSKRNENHMQNIYQPHPLDATPSAGSDGYSPPVRVWQLHTAVSSFRSVSACHDVASTSDGRVLLAALGRGLKQYDCSGKKLPTWHPPVVDGQHGLVSSIDTLDDGKRVAAAVINARRVYLLSTDEGSDWVEDNHFDLWLWPYRVSTRRDLMAVVGANAAQKSKTTQFGPGRQLVVMSVGDGASKLEIELDFDANAVTLAEHAVIVAGEMGQATGSDGGGEGGKARHFVDAYSYGRCKELLWRYDTGHDVGDVCVAPLAAAGSDVGVYLAVPDSRQVLALDVGNGRLIGEVLRASGQASPNRLSFSLGEERRVLTVLSARGIVTVYPLDSDGTTSKAAFETSNS